MTKVLLRQATNFPPFGFIVLVEVVEGVLKIGMKLNLEGRIMELKRMEALHKTLNEAKVGEKIWLNLKNGDLKIIQKHISHQVEFI